MLSVVCLLSTKNMQYCKSEWALWSSDWVKTWFVSFYVVVQYGQSEFLVLVVSKCNRVFTHKFEQYFVHCHIVHSATLIHAD